MFGTLILVLLRHAQRPARPQHGDAGDERRAGLAAALALALAGAALVYGGARPNSIPIVLSILQFGGINVVLAVSLNITNGFIGLFSLGHPAFMTIGGYVTAILTMPAGAQGP